VSALKTSWSKVPAKQRRYLAMAGVGVLLVLVLWFFASSDSDSARADSGQKVIENVLTDDNTRDIGIDALSARLDKLSKENDTLRREQQRIKKESNSGQGAQGAENSREIQKLQRTIEQDREKYKALAARITNGDDDAGDRGNAEGDRPNKNTRGDGSARATGIYDSPSDAGTGFNADEVFNTPGVDADPPTGRNAGDSEKAKPTKIVTISEDIDEPEPEREGNDHRSYLPAGSIVTVTTLSGMDAPTGQAARRDPLPSLMRIKHEAILPNRFRQDVKECFLLASGYGDLSSERAYLRAETLSCVRQDGGVIEQKLQAFATGEDGKAGVRGRLVSKQGAIIGRSLMAGFLSGASKAFDVNPVPTINTTNSGEQEYQKVFSSNSVQGAAVSGASDALDRIAKFYIDMAESMYPVIEINAGRKISFIVQSGVSLNAEK